MIRATHGIIQSKAAAAASVITSGLSLYIDPSIVAPSGTVVYNYLGVAVGTAAVNPIYVNDPTYGGVMRFSGTNQFISLTSGYTYTSGFTFQFFIKRSNTGGFTTMSTLMGRGTNTRTVMFDANDGMPIGHRQHLLIETDITYDTELSTDTTSWRMLTIVSQATSGQPLLIYTNDVATPLSTSGGSIASGTMQSNIGSDIGGRYYKGDFGNFLFYNRVLNTNEIKNNYDVLKGRFGL